MNKIQAAAAKADKQIDFVKIIKPLLENTPFWAKLSGNFAANQLEKNDDKIFEWLLSMAYDKVPAEYHGDLDAVLQAYIDSDIEAFRVVLSDKLVKAIKTPLGDRKEGIITDHLTKMILELMEDDLVELADSVGGGGPGDDPTDPDPEDETTG